jgi:hypothetical protein
VKEIIWNPENCGEALNHAVSTSLYFLGISSSLMCVE